MTTNDKNIDSNDNYDYLDDLMQDVMSDSIIEAKEDTVVHDTIVDSKKTAVDKETEEYTKGQEVIKSGKEEENKPRKRLPLFQRIDAPVVEETIIDIEVVDEPEDSFEDMLEEIEDIFEDKVCESEPSTQDKLIDPDVIVPLETPDMREVKVTADGRTLADMLPGMRSGNKTVDRIVKDIREQNNIIEVDGKKFSDNRYTEHVKEIDKERAEQDKRREYSKKFLQRNAEFTEQEKIIMDNLGVSNKQFTDLMKSKELTFKEKEELIGLGKYGAEKHFKGRKYKTTVGDMAMLEFIAKFKFANTRILRWISNEPQGRTWRKLDRLKNNGLVEQQSIIGIPDLWGTTYAGMGISGYTFTPGLKPMPKMITISSTMGINYIAACLWFNTVNVLNLEDFPAINRTISTQMDGRNKVRGENLVSELEIRSSLGKEINPQSTTMQSLGDETLYNIIGSNVRSEILKWQENGKLGQSPEFHLGNEYMWVLYPISHLTKTYHVPDLVVKRERGPQGQPKSIAVEMERYDKSNDDYNGIMLSYKLDEHLYEKVIWITPNTRVARALERAAEEVGFTRYSILPIITETGTYNKQDIWMI